MAGRSLSESSTIEVSIVVMIAAAIAAGMSWATTIGMKQDAIREDLESLAAQVENGTHDRWTGANMRAWVLQASKEVQIWTAESEHAMDLPEGTLIQFHFPDPDEIRGR